MKKWEYKTVNTWPERNLADSELNAFGDEGWELISIGRSNYTYSGSSYEYYFKREKV